MDLPGGLEEAAQRAVAEHPEWLLARRLNYIGKDYIAGDSRPELQLLGFKILGEANGLFYRVQPPEGWNKSTEGSWTIFVDRECNERIFQYYSPQDRKSFLNIITLITSTETE